MTGVVLYSRSGCHLCDEAARVLSSRGLPFDVVDIDKDPDLQSRYGQCVPVVVMDGKERFRGRIDLLLLERLLAHRGRT